MSKFRALLAFLLVSLLVALPSLSVAAGESEIDRSTPRRTMTAFLVAVEARDYTTAASLMDLSSVPYDLRRRGPELAAELQHVLERNVWIEPDLLSDDPQGNPADGVDVERIGTVRSAGVDVPITLRRISKERGWAISASTVARIPRLYEEHAPGFLESRVPAALRGRAWGLAAWQWLGVLAAMALAIVIGRAVTFVGVKIGGKLAAGTEAQWDDELVVALRRPSRFLFGVLAFHELLGMLALSAAAAHVFGRLLGMITIGAAAWALVGVVGVISRVVERRVMVLADGGGEGGLRARGVKTQVRVLRRVVNVAIAILAVGLMLTQFEVVRNIGMSLLASAGVAGVVLGFAAQRTIGSLIAGIQMSFTQPIRIGDVVIVEKEWGTIEEITLTFVVVRIWDERRLVVPMTRFLEQPFENWTKVSPTLHGTVFFQVDWRLPIDDVRRELDRILEGHALWDGRTKTVTVTNTTDRTIEVRALVSAANSSDLWGLRTHVRERIVAWLCDHEGGKYLPRVRIDEGGADDRARSAAVDG
ncbi:MAG: mechanosensitive ion channel [Labilithrix sp.]|nr:mechanosensitive ion channel [Labilithrix sp.]MBX3223694.1 mechanosensitive ion channel [Labilithrix sp.]